MQSFETKRLLIRPLCIEDETFYCNCYTDPILMQHIGEPLTHEVALCSFKAALKVGSKLPLRRYTWAMQEKTSGIAVGLLAIFFDQAQARPMTAELGNIMLTKFQNQGYTVEALSELINLAFDTTGLITLVAKHKTKNAAVTRVMTKLGFVRDFAELADTTNCQWVLHRDHWLVQSAASSPR